MTVESDLEFEDDDINDKVHNKLVEDILNLNKKQNIKKPSRTEPTSEVSEFNLVKSSGKRGSVHINELTKVLGNRKKQLDISRVVKVKNKKTLPTPLHKPQAEQIRRTLNYEKSRLQLDRWEAYVTSNRVANLSFPLVKAEKFKDLQKKAETFPTRWRMKTELQKELEQLEPIVIKPLQEEESEKYQLTLEELQEKRKEAAKLRAYQSYKEAKLRRQSKIKSKKYHRILKRERIKQKLKEFEELQKTNPEEAIRKLDEIEKARAEERFSLRHKGTGQWAKSKQVRAKFDKESRQVLAQQLAISRDLTQKIKPTHSDSEDDMETEESHDNKTDPSNPWVNGVKPEKEVGDFVSGFRKYWLEHNKSIEQNETLSENKSMETPKKKTSTKNIEDPQKKTRKIVKATVPKPKEKKNKRLSQNSIASTSDWDVTVLSDEEENEVDDGLKRIFNNIEDKMSKRIKENYSKVENFKKTTKKNKQNQPKIKTKVDLTMKPAVQKQIIDEELLESTTSMDDTNTENSIENFKNIIKNLNYANQSTINDTPSSNKEPININPEKFLQVKTTTLDTDIPDFAYHDENEEDDDKQKKLIQEAFEDDDITEDFKKDKEKLIDEETEKDIDLTLPGWGSWGGTGIKPSKRKNRRLILKMPPAPPRRDENKGSLIINEKAASKIKPLLVSEIPFPFKTVKDYEASIRAPIGNTFVPERAFKKLIEPTVTTKMGAIIEPVTRATLMGHKPG